MTPHPMTVPVHSESMLNLHVTRGAHVLDQSAPIKL